MNQNSRIKVDKDRSKPKSGKPNLSGRPVNSESAGAIPPQAAGLNDPRFQMAQRQAMAAHLGGIGGNRYLQRAIASQTQDGQNDEEPNRTTKPAAPPPAGVVQRLIVNAGSVNLDNLDWIIYKDIQIALQKKPAQEIVEFANADFSKVAPEEDIYFVGHGHAGFWTFLTSQEPDDLPTLKRMTELPQGYKGKIISLSCRAGQPLNLIPSGVSDVAKMLEKERPDLNVSVSGAKEMAYQHPEFGSRVAQPGMSPEIDQAIKKGQDDVDKAWQEWLAQNPGKSVREKAQAATAISKEFYKSFLVDTEPLNQQLEKYFLPKDQAYQEEQTGKPP